MLGLLTHHGPVAQSGERRPRMAEVTSSSLVGSTYRNSHNYAGNSRLRGGPGENPGPHYTNYYTNAAPTTTTLPYPKASPIAPDAAEANGRAPEHEGGE
jgi:hypothetical protein